MHVLVCRFVFTFFAVLVFCALSVGAQAQDFDFGNSFGDGSSSALPQADAPPGSSEFDISAEFSDIQGLAGGADDSAQMSKEEMSAKIRDEAFKAALLGMMPMEPGEIRRLLERYDETQKAVQTPVYPYPEPELVVKEVSLDPGSVPPIIKVAAGNVTTLTFMDATGTPWPIESMAYAGDFSVEHADHDWIEGVNGNRVRIIPKSEFAYGNISVDLFELETPVIFTIRTTRDTVHYRFDARIPEIGPWSKPPIIESGVSIKAGGSVQSAVLDGVPPQGAERLSVEGVDGRTAAYKYQGLTYVRTPLTLLSPGWSSSVSSVDGMNVYVMNDAPVLLLSDKGRVVRAHLREEVTEE